MPSLGDLRAGPLSGRSFSVDGFSIIPAPDAARFVFRTRGVAVDTAGRAFGVDLPRQALRTSATSARTAAWIGPDEWLLLGPESEKALIEQQLTEALTGIAHSLVDVSHRDPAIALSGARAAAALNTGCPLDLHPFVFTVGMCAHAPCSARRRSFSGERVPSCSTCSLRAPSPTMSGDFSSRLVGT
jgi:sarcosine oxidase subunit gamma